MDKRKSTTKKVALCGVFAALCLAILWVGGMTLLDLSVLVVCALMTMLLVVEAGEKMTWVYAAATSVLALLLLPSKLYALEYLLFAAVYPILKLHFERLPALLAWKSCHFLMCLLTAITRFVQLVELSTKMTICLVLPVLRNMAEFMFLLIRL